MQPSTANRPRRRSWVKTHVAAVLRKLGLRDRTQAVVWAYETGFVRPGDNGG